MLNNLISQIATLNLHTANLLMESVCGIVDYFDVEKDKDDFIVEMESCSQCLNESQVEYGDWQTPLPMAREVCKLHLANYGVPDILIEPTCGKGNFIMAAMETMPGTREIYGIEINPSYTKELKKRILLRQMDKGGSLNCKIHIITANVFEYGFKTIFENAKYNQHSIAIIGNPPWVTNSTLGSKQSKNLPNKSNLFRLKGIEALTGKSNFDISEAICISLIGLCNGINGAVSLLLKNSVVRNILNKQKKLELPLEDITQLNINAKKEFDVSVDACCLQGSFGPDLALTCKVKDFYNGHELSEYGWDEESFVSNLELFKANRQFEGKSPYEWRSGIKHDCAAVLELTENESGYINGLGEEVSIEQDLVYPLMKSSDISKYGKESIRKHILLPQRFTGEDSLRLMYNMPLTHEYLVNHINWFRQRKSSIYKGKSEFSIFGIGEYSFKPYKIAVSSLYKNIEFRLVTPHDGKPVMFDDTCYTIGFDDPEKAQEVLEILESREITDLIQSLVFPDSKRVITKSLLMRLDIDSVARLKSKSGVIKQVRQEVKQLSLFD